MIYSRHVAVRPPAFLGKRVREETRNHNFEENFLNCFQDFHLCYSAWSCTYTQQDDVDDNPIWWFNVAHGWDDTSRTRGTEVRGELSPLMPTSLLMELFFLET